MGPEDLTAILRRLPSPAFNDQRVLVGTDTHDDAGVFQLTESVALVQTVDFFTPVVDDPRMFGRIAATNSLSDIYAMGATPLTALNLLATPAGVLEPEVVAEMLAGGQEAMAEAGVSVIGGHTIDDPEPKIGYAVTGTVHPDHIWRNSSARAGEYVYLTKAIGTGVIVKAIKEGVASPDVSAHAVAMMTESNRRAWAAIRTAGGPGACTDVTGFGLLGHLWEMAESSKVRVRVREAEVPILPGALSLAEKDFFPQGSRRNWEFVEPHLIGQRFFGPVAYLLADAVTSGGLLFTVPESRRQRLEESFSRHGVPLWEIGKVMEGEPGIELV